MSRFTVAPLLNDQALVVGTDYNNVTNQVVVSTSEWNDIKGHNNFVEATANFDAAVEEFYAELTEAADAVNLALNATTAPDPMSSIVLHEGVEGVEAKPAVVRQLSTDSIILRIIEAGDTDRLVWVGDQLQVLAAPTFSEAPFVTSPTGTDGPVDEPATEKRGFFG